MNKTTFVFIGGSLFGIIGAFAIIKSTSAPDLTENILNDQVQKTELQPKKIQSPQHSIESMSNMDRLDSKIPSNTDMSNMPNIQADQTNQVSHSNNSNSGTAAEQIAITTTPEAIPVIPPTTEQVEQYDDIDNLITSAVNNPNIKLHYLIKKADSLTIEQRKILTQRAIVMLERGELNIDQFASK